MLVFCNSRKHFSLHFDALRIPLYWNQGECCWCLTRCGKLQQQHDVRARLQKSVVHLGTSETSIRVIVSRRHISFFSGTNVNIDLLPPESPLAGRTVQRTHTRRRDARLSCKYYELYPPGGQCIIMLSAMVPTVQQQPHASNISRLDQSKGLQLSVFCLTGGSPHPTVWHCPHPI